MNAARLTRIALFAALVYVFSWATTFLPNVNLSFFIIFSAGFLWGAGSGMLVGAVGMGIYTTFNPYGPAPLPISLAQVIGGGLVGLVGALFAIGFDDRPIDFTLVLRLAVAGALAAIIFYLPVNVVDAWLFQPFWPRFVTGLVWAGLSVVSNMLIFPLLFGVTVRIYRRERQ